MHLPSDAGMTIAPGSTIGIIGGGQLGRMLAMAAAQLGYFVRILDPDRDCCAAQVASAHDVAEYDDAPALARFGAAVDVVTYEFENIAAAPLDALAARAPLFPPLSALRVAQDRIEEKRFAAAQGGRTADWAAVSDAAELAAAVARVGVPAILKTARLGYDGKGQARIAEPLEASGAWDSIGRKPAILEAMVPLTHEFSLLVARGRGGESVTWDAAQNVHEDGILATSTVPATTAIAWQVEAARGLAVRLADALGYVGVLAIEFFATADGPVFNEMAPRVHNSGHWTIEGAVTSQFENHIRAICGLPLGSADLRGTGAFMHNLIGPAADDWARLAADPHVALHLYGKGEARDGRKMGHWTRVEHG